MALPIRAKDTQEGCNPISSNCVIWQGPDIPCINLCKGDSISDVTSKVAEQLCTLLDQTNVSTFDITCFNPVCPNPRDFHDLIQLLIDRICALNGIPVTPGGGAGCPDCVVPVAQCLQRPDALGNITATLQLKDYVILIGNQICSSLTTISGLQTQIDSLDTRVSDIEANCCGSGGGSDLVMPASVCLSTPAGTPVIDYLVALDTAFCALQTSSGSQNDTNTALGYKCIDSSDTLPIGTGTYGTIPGWINSPTNLAQAVQDLWLVACQQNDAILALNANIEDLQLQLEQCCNAAVGCAGIRLIATGYLEALNPPAGWYISTSFTQALSNLPAGWSFCPTGSTYTISPSNNDPNNPLPTLTINAGNCSSGATPPNLIRYGCPWRTVYFTGPNAEPNFDIILGALFVNMTIQACLTNGTDTCTVSVELPTIQGPGAGVSTVMTTGGTVENPTVTGIAYPDGYPVEYDEKTTWTMYLRLGNNDGPIVGSNKFTSATKGSPLSYTFNSGILPNQSYGMTIDIFQGNFAKTGIQASNNVVTASAQP
jgi:hypothetical protein